ncbi:cupin domain-containing protein [Octadecabacter sp. CECT 8868]|uniref:cupin domain-containing protein n=1 Tax=Octadecabacter algicola TaxID=2909342 RepID=UPI001F22BA59|nr:cupin domain-containing protein [Octadecabacter algicola]MCF2904842.1 cupin domain-containing protein [Octadecabacter algicola]
MAFATFIDSFPSLDVPIPQTTVTTKAIASDAGLVVFFTFHEDFELPPHSHKGQWGTVVMGQIELTMDGTSKVYGPGESYDIPSGMVHSVKVKSGTQAIDVFEEGDRYGLKD